MASVELSYYYGYEAEQFSFYRIPKLLFTDSRFAGISTDAKLLYGILLDRMSLSMKNGWHDEQGRVYIIFTLDDVAETLGYKTEMERQAQIEQEIQQRTELRQPLYAKRRCETDENIKEELVREIDRQTASLRQLRKERALCKRIEQQVPGIQQNLREFEENKSQNQKEAVRHEYQRRNR